MNLTGCAKGVCAALAGALLHGSPAWCQSRADYVIQASLEGETKVLTGRERISWTNGTADAVDQAWFHLYLNAFSNNRSTHLVEARGRLRGHAVEEGWGWSRVTAIAALDPAGGAPVDLMPSFRYERPDDGNPEDRTVFAVDLPRAVQPGETLELSVEWQAQLPRVRRRTGYKDEFLLVAQWFPKLGVYEEGEGWNCHQFHANTEFFADYGTYEVELDLPRAYENKVFGSGSGSSKVESDRTIARLFAPDVLDRSRPDAFGLAPLVHDFAWTASPRFVVDTKTFRPSDWMEEYPEEVERVRAALGEEALSMRNVDVVTLMQPEHADQAERHHRATSAALFFYGLWFGEYPYQRVTVVDPAWGAGGAGGMEYPTLFTAGTRLFTDESMHDPEGVTVHEAGHQFWYGLVGNNEFESAWLDEGFNSYTDSEVLWRVFGPERHVTEYAALFADGVALAPIEGSGALGAALGLRDVPAVLGVALRPLASTGFLAGWRDQPALTFAPQWTDPRWADRAGYLRDPDSDPVDTAAFLHVDRASYRANSYPRTAAALRTLQHVVGDTAFLRGMRRYAEEWRYRHPTPDDFFRAFREGAAKDCQWYFDEVFRTTETGDWQIEVEQRRRPRDRGLFQGEGGEFLERPAPEDDAAEGPWQAEIVLRRDGGLSLSMPVRLAFDDGTVRDEVWTREEQLARGWKRIEIEGEAKLISAQIDPEGRIFLDADRSNDAWFDRSDALAPWRWGERALVHAQHALHFLGGVGG